MYLVFFVYGQHRSPRHRASIAANPTRKTSEKEYLICSLLAPCYLLLNLADL